LSNVLNIQKTVLVSNVPDIRKTVLVTGASSGFGRATTLNLARQGYSVIAVSRSLARLDELTDLAQHESLKISTRTIDISDPESVAKHMPGILSEVGELDVLVNNAGYSLRGCWESLTLDEVRCQFETNFLGPLTMAQAVLPHMRERGKGLIINVGSMAAHVGRPAGGAYAASKAALASLTKVMRMEVEQFGIQVVLLEPGKFRTRYNENRVTGTHVSDPQSPYHSLVQRIRKKRESSSNKQQAGDPIKVAKTIAQILMARQPKQRYVIGADARLWDMAAKFLPDSILELFVKKDSGL
jgi:NAD(P)-dependent dehydrogenase (short-subunit alcohol dehydrogenase family)